MNASPPRPETAPRSSVKHDEPRHPRKPLKARRWLLFSIPSLAAAALIGLGIGFFVRQFRPPIEKTGVELAGENLGLVQASVARPVAVTPRKLADIPFDGDQAFKYLEQICAIGPRFSGSKGMVEQQKLLEEHFNKLGGKVRRQEFRARHPLSGEATPMTNLIVEWHPGKAERIILCAHYDTRPFADRDRRNKQGTFIGANDGASGTALLMALADQMVKVDCKYGVDFVLFDGEELVFRVGDEDRGEYFLGSDWFAREYKKSVEDGSAPYRYKSGVLFDMVGDKQLQIFLERHSITWENTRPITFEIWATARALGVREFIAKEKYEIRDDHLPLHNVANIPCVDIIDFDYEHWHTMQDTADKCSGESLAKVGKVILEWLRVVK